MSGLHGARRAKRAATCSRCHRILVVARAWRAEQAGDGTAPNGARGLCRNCLRQGGDTPLVYGPPSPIVGNCVGCGRRMVSRRALRDGSFDPRTTRAHNAHGRCSTCVKRLWDSGINRAEQRPLTEVLEEYALVRDQVGHIREAAQRLGMTEDGLERALYRARKQGLPGALPPLQQVEVAIDRGIGKTYLAYMKEHAA